MAIKYSDTFGCQRLNALRQILSCFSLLWSYRRSLYRAIVCCKMNISPSWLYTIPPPPSSAKVVPQPIAHTSPRIQPEYPGERGNLIPISGHRSSPNPITMEARSDSRSETGTARFLFRVDDNTCINKMSIWSQRIAHENTSCFSIVLGYISIV